MFKKLLVSMFVFVILFSLAGCAAKPAEEAAAPAAPATGAGLKLSGMLNQEQSLALDAMKGMETKQVPYTNKAGETTNYTGVPIVKLLEAAGLKEGAKSVVFVGSDGYTAEVALADIQACADCIVGFQDDGTFMNIMPGLPGNAQVKGLAEIQVK